MITRFMQVMFSAAENQDEELTSQVADDIEEAKAKEEGDGKKTDEVTYINLGSGKVLIVDEEAGEATIAEQNEENPEQYDLEGFNNDEDLEKYLHTLDGVTPDEENEETVTEDVHDHLTDEEYENAPNLNPNASIKDTKVTDMCPECGCNPCECEEEDEEEEDEEKTYSVMMTEEELAMFSEYLYGTNNTATLKVYSNADLYCRIFSDVLEEEKPAIIGDLKIEKEDDDTIVVTDLESGDSAQVTVNEDDEFVINDTQRELSDEEKTYSVIMTEEELAMFSEYLEGETEEEDEEEEENNEHVGPNDHMPIYVVGIDPQDHLIVDAPVYSEEDAQALMDRLEEDGVTGLEAFEDATEAQKYALELLQEAGVTDVEEQISEPEEHAFSDVTLYTTRYFSDCTEFMFKLFSEADEEITDTQDEIEEAIEKGEQTETETEIITPIDEETAIVHDKENDEYTKVTLDGEDLNTQKLTEEEADELLDTKEEEEPKTEEEPKEEEEEEKKEFSVLDRFFADIEETSTNVDPNTGNPVEENDEVAPVATSPLEAIEDKALEAVQSIQEAANEAVLAITDAKEAPAPGEEQDLKEAQFSEKDTLATWFASI